MRRMTALFSLILIVASCGDADDTSETTAATGTTAFTLSSADAAFNEEVLDRFRIIDIGGLDPDSVDSSDRISAFLQPVSPAEGVIKYICGDRLPDGYVLSYSFGPTGSPPDAPALIDEFKDFATETYCP